MSINPKTLGKDFLCHILEGQFRKLRARHPFTLIAVAGSVGKTSTKLAIAKTLSASQKVIYQEGNYNARLTVPLTLFGHELPGLFNIAAWARIIFSNRHIISSGFPYDFAVVELGTDHPGEMTEFAYLRPDITVVTAVREEHMQFFKSLEAVAKEELTIFEYSLQILVNTDDTSSEFLHGYEYKTYGLNQDAEYRVHDIKPNGLRGSSFTIDIPGKTPIVSEVAVLGVQGAKICLAAAAVADLVGLSPSEIALGLRAITPFAGRMSILAGIKGSTIIDDSYNASPASVLAAIDVLYGTQSEQRIVILGSMNELGTYSREAHRRVGAYCDPDRLDLVVTIGAEAERYLAPAASKAGCSVRSFSSAREAGDYVAQKVEGPSTVILVKGSETGVFAEEAIKVLLNSPEDQAKLVRQSPSWQKKKGLNASKTLA